LRALTLEFLFGHTRVALHISADLKFKRFPYPKENIDRKFGKACTFPQR
jgi:hypothetical protein